MGNRKRSEKIDKARVHQALEENKITMVKASEELGFKYVESFRKAVNTLQELQEDHIARLAKLTGKEESYFYSEKYVKLAEDRVLPSGKVIAHKGDKIPVPKSKNNFKKEDVSEFLEVINSSLISIGLGEFYKDLSENGKGSFNATVEGLFMIAMKIHRNLSEDQIDDLIDSFDTLADGYISKHSGK